jgi:lipopolysaccharide export system protein LptA
MKTTVLVLLIASAFTAGPALAEQADRNKPTQWEAERSSHDDLNQVSILEGNVVITRGTFVLRAQRVELRQDPEGYQFGVATGTAAVPASFRQKRDGPDDQYVEGNALRIDYNGKADTVTLTNAAQLRRLEKGVLADEVSGQVIVYDSRVEKYNVVGGKDSASTTNPQGRVHGTIAPRAPAATGQDGKAPANAAPLRGAGAVGDAATKR